MHVLMFIAQVVLPGDKLPLVTFASLLYSKKVPALPAHALRFGGVG